MTKSEQKVCAETQRIGQNCILVDENGRFCKLLKKSELYIMLLKIENARSLFLDLGEILSIKNHVRVESPCPFKCYSQPYVKYCRFFISFGERN